MGSDWTVDTLKEYVDSALRERKYIDDQLNEILKNFPQDYCTSNEFEKLRTSLENIRSDHVQRREFDSLKEEHAQNRGMRIALSISSGIMIALISVALGAMYANQLSHRDVSEQIQIESPWAIDRIQVDHRLDLIEQKQNKVILDLNTHEQIDKLRALTSKKG